MPPLRQAVQGSVDPGCLRGGAFLRVRNDQKLERQLPDAAVTNCATAGRDTNTLTAHVKQEAAGERATAGRNTNTLPAQAKQEATEERKTSEAEQATDPMSDEAIRAAIKHLAPGSVIDVTWRLRQGNTNTDTHVELVTATTWRGIITRQGGRGSSVEYFGSPERWENHTTDSILPNPEIEVCNIAYVVVKTDKAPDKQQKQKVPKAQKQQQKPQKDNNTTRQVKQMSRQVKAAKPPPPTPTPEAKVAAQANTPPSTSPTAPPTYQPPDVEWDTIFNDQPEAATIGQNTQPPNEQAEVEMDAEADSTDDDISDVDSIAEQIRYWDPTQEQQAPIQPGAAQPGHLGCPAQRPTSCILVPHRSPPSPDGGRRPSSHHHQGAQEGAADRRRRDDGGSAECTVTKRPARVHQQKKKEKTLAMDHDSDANEHDAGGTCATPSLRNASGCRRDIDGTSLAEALPRLVHGHESSCAQGQGANRQTTESSIGQQHQKGPQQPAPQHRDEGLHPPHLGHGQQMRRCAEAAHSGLQAPRSQGDDHFLPRKDSGEERSIHSEQLHPHGCRHELSAECSGPTGLPSLPQHHGQKDQGGATHVNGRQQSGTTKPQTRSTAGAGSSGNGAHNSTVVFRTHDSSNVAEVPRTRHESSSPEQRHDRCSSNDIRVKSNDKPTKEYQINQESIREKLRHIGQAAASWHDLGKRNPKTSDLPPHLKTEAIGALDWTLLEKLEKTAQQARDCEEVMLWVTDSEYYQKIRQHMMNNKMRDIVGHMKDEDALLFEHAKKFRRVTNNETTQQRAFCNAFWRPEWEKNRRRSLLEPLINDIIDAINAQDVRSGRQPSLPYSVKYTDKRQIRQSVLVHTHAALADMSSWFDQLRTADTLHPLFSISTEGGNAYEVVVTAMGYKPACKVAHKTLAAIAPPPEVAPQALFVDNIALYGSEGVANENMSVFLQRARQVGAIVNKENNRAQTCYEFLGEKYDHNTKTRSLTEKTRDKCAFIAETLANIPTKATAANGSITVRCQKVLAIIGTLTYAAEILDIPMSSMIEMLMLLSSASVDAAHRGTWDHNIKVSSTARQQMMNLALEAEKNVPVHVTFGRKATATAADEKITIFVDASVWGYGAVITSSTGTKFVSQQWTMCDHAEATALGGHLGSSATAEPLAARRILCAVGGPRKDITLHTDHHALVDLAGRTRCSPNMGYNKFTCLVDELSRVCSVAVVFVPGDKNPADPLSRGRPPILSVTHIGGPPMYG